MSAWEDDHCVTRSLGGYSSLPDAFRSKDLVLRPDVSQVSGPQVLYWYVCTEVRIFGLETLFLRRYCIESTGCRW